MGLSTEERYYGLCSTIKELTRLGQELRTFVKPKKKKSK